MNVLKFYFKVSLTHVINLTNNILSEYTVFSDVGATILEKENRHNNREDIHTSLKTGGDFGGDEKEVNGTWPQWDHNNGKSKSGRKKIYICFKCSKPDRLKNYLLVICVHSITYKLILVPIYET